MIIEISNENSIVKWKNNDKDEWKVAEISDLIKAYDRMVLKSQGYEQGYERGYEQAKVNIRRGIMKLYSEHNKPIPELPEWLGI